jgi:predicted nuclease of predicted toxin-antitoxin system
MVRLYADENFPLRVVEALRQMGHDILTAHDAGQANKRIPDDQILAFACSEQRAVLTYNRNHFIRLHNSQPPH